MYLIKDDVSDKTYSNFTLEEINQSDSRFIMFTSEECKYCVALMPIIKNHNNTDNNSIYFYDIDKNKKIPEEYNIEYVPTIIYFKQGKEISRFNEYADYEKFFSEGLFGNIVVDKEYTIKKLNEWVYKYGGN